MAYVWLSELLMSQDIFPRKMLKITNEKKQDNALFERGVYSKVIAPSTHEDKGLKRR